MSPIRVGLNRILGAFILGVGGFNGYVFFLTGNKMQLALACVFGLVGVLYLIGNALVVTDHEVQIKNPLGMTLKSHRITSLTDLAARDKKLFLGEKKIASLGFAVSGSDARRLEQAIADARAGEPK